LSARHACDGDPLLPGAVLIGPPDHHLLGQEGRVRRWTGPHENRHRPAVDPLFRSAAAVYGSSVIGVVLSGAFNDGAAGLATMKAAGGVAVV
jgi:two-component system chemotaxis response regulator CheB